MADAAMAQLVEHILGKDEVPGPNPGSSSRQPRREIFGALVFYRRLLIMAGHFLLIGVVRSCYSRLGACFRTRSEENRFAMPPQSASSLLVSDKVSIIRLRISESAPDFSLRLGHTRGKTILNRFLTRSCRFATPKRNLRGFGFYRRLLIMAGCFSFVKSQTFRKIFTF